MAVLAKIRALSNETRFEIVKLVRDASITCVMAKSCRSSFSTTSVDPACPRLSFKLRWRMRA